MRTRRVVAASQRFPRPGRRCALATPDALTTTPRAGLTVRDVARRYRVSPDKVRRWIQTGQRAAVNTASARCGKPRYVILPHHLTDFERARSAGPAPKATRRRRRTCAVDYYPDPPPPARKAVRS